MLNFSIFNFDNITEKDNNKDWPYRKLVIGPSGSGKTNYLLNFIQRDNREKAGINFNNDPNAFIEYSNSMDDILSDIEDYNKKKSLNNI